MADASDATDEGRAATFATFSGGVRLAAGTLAETAVAAKRALDRGDHGPVLVFDPVNGAVVDLDLRGTEADVGARYAPPSPSGSKRGRPKLGVVAREVTLLPRHWEWLADQPGGASVALRRLVDAARKAGGEEGATRARVEAAYRFMSAMAGDLAGFEDAARALFAQDRDRLTQCVQAWPPDIQDQIFRYLGAKGEKTRHG